MFICFHTVHFISLYMQTKPDLDWMKAVCNFFDIPRGAYISYREDHHQAKNRYTNRKENDVFMGSITILMILFSLCVTYAVLKLFMEYNGLNYRTVVQSNRTLEEICHHSGPLWEIIWGSNHHLIWNRSANIFFNMNFQNKLFYI